MEETTNNKTPQENTNKSANILGASSNLLGLCFIVMTSLKILKLTTQARTVNKFMIIAIVAFMASSVFSFLAIRSKTKRGVLFENIADIVFLVGLFILFGTTMLIAFDFIM
jgi:hypothetical protein